MSLIISNINYYICKLLKCKIVGCANLCDPHLKTDEPNLAHKHTQNSRISTGIFTKLHLTLCKNLWFNTHLFTFQSVKTWRKIRKRYNLCIFFICKLSPTGNLHTVKVCCELWCFFIPSHYKDSNPGCVWMFCAEGLGAF